MTLKEKTMFSWYQKQKQTIFFNYALWYWWALRLMLDRNEYGGGILETVQEHIPSKLLSNEKLLHKVKIHIRKKWTLRCIYNPHWNFISGYVGGIEKTLDLHLANYYHIFLRSKFNAEVYNYFLKEFPRSYNKRAQMF